MVFPHPDYYFFLHKYQWSFNANGNYYYQHCQPRRLATTKKFLFEREIMCTILQAHTAAKHMRFGFVDGIASRLATETTSTTPKAWKEPCCKDSALWRRT